ncbi:replication initiation protein, partial [Shigella sonnei]
RRVWALLFDVDQPLAAMAWDAAGLPPPTWTAQNPENGHAHIAYALSAPVAKSDAARLKPLRLLARIQHAMTDALSADKGYVGLITKTPNHERWRTTVWRPEPYSMDELRDYLPDNLELPRRIKKSEAIGIGRNVSLFDSLAAWSYKKRLNYTDPQAWFAACLNHAEALNTFATPLEFNEIKATAKSVAKWTWTHITEAGLRDWHSRKGRARAASTNALRQQKAFDIQAGLLL